MSVLVPPRHAPPTHLSQKDDHSPAIYRANSSNPSMHQHQQQHQSLTRHSHSASYMEEPRRLSVVPRMAGQQISTQEFDTTEAFPEMQTEEVLPSSVLNAPGPPGPTLTSETLAPQTTVLQKPQLHGTPFPSTATLGVGVSSSQLLGSPLYSPGRTDEHEDGRFTSRSSRPYTASRSGCSRCGHGKHGKEHESQSRQHHGRSPRVHDRGSPRRSAQRDVGRSRDESMRGGRSARHLRQRSLSDGSISATRTHDTSSRTSTMANQKMRGSSNKPGGPLQKNLLVTPRQAKDETVSSSQGSFTRPVREKVLTRRGASGDFSEGKDSTDWSVASKWLKAVRAGPFEVPDYILTKHPGFKDEKHPSPFALYYFDETAPNELLLANDVKGEHPVTVAKKQLQAFLNCEGGRQEAFEVEGDAYSPDGVVDMSTESNDSDDSKVYAKSYYTESAFTSISANAILRGRTLQAMQGGDKKVRGGEKGSKKGCCNKPRRISGPSTADLELDQASSREMSSNRQPLPGAGIPGRVYSYPQPVNSPSQLYSAPAHPAPAGYAGNVTAPGYRGPMSEVYQKFSKVRKTNYVEYTPPATIAKRYNHPGYHSALEVEATRQQRNAAIPAVWPRPEAPVTADGRPALSTVSGTQTSRFHRSGRNISRDIPVSSKSRQPHTDPSRRSRGTSKRGASLSRSISVNRTRGTRTRSVSAESYHEARKGPRPGVPAHRRTGGQVCRQCRGTGHVRDQAGRAGLCGECCVVRRGGGWCCGTSQPEHHRHSSRGYPQDSFDDSITFGRSTYGSTYTGTQATVGPEIVNFEVMGRGDDAISVDDGPKYKPPIKGEEKRDYGYHLRKHFFDAANLKPSSDGTKFKALPQYSVSYRNYPTICYDVVVPTSQRDFYRVRKAPGFA